MKKIICLLLAVTMMLGLSFALVGCSAPADDGAEIGVYLGNEIYDLDPTDYYVNKNAEQVMSLIFEPLFRINAKGGLELAQAKSYVVDEEEREIVIDIRETYWSDGSRVKAEDFVYAWCERLLSPNSPNPAAALLYDIENAAAVKGGVVGFSSSDVAARVTGTYQITITYRHGADYNQLLRNLASVATAPVRRSVVEANPTNWAKSSITIVTNGPFQVRRYSLADLELSLSRNKGYYQPTDTVDFDNIVIPGALVGFFSAAGEELELTYDDIESKTVFYLFDAPVDMKTGDAAKAVKKADTSVYTYVFNTERELFAIPEVRLALSLAIDRAAIVAAIGEGIAADGFVPTVSGGSAEALIEAEANKERAEELLSSVNLKGVSKSFTITVANDEKSLVVADMVKAAWTDLGFKVTVKTAKVLETVLPPETKDSDPVEIKDDGIQVLAKEASFGNYDFDVLAVDWQTFTTDSFVALASLSSHMNGNGKDFDTGLARKSVSGWFDAKYDEIINEAFKSTGAERKALLDEAEAYLVEAAPVCPIFFNENVSFVSPELSGVLFDGFGNVIFTKVQQKNYQNYLEDED